MGPIFSIKDTENFHINQLSQIEVIGNLDVKFEIDLKEYITVEMGFTLR